MPKNAWIVMPSLLTDKHVVADLSEIRRYNPQRFEMEQLTAVVHEDTSHHVCVGYKDVAENEWWMRGHIVNAPAMPMPLMCDAAAQLVNYYVLKHELCVSMGHLIELRRVRCRQLVVPGERLFVVARLLKVRIAQVVSEFQCFVQQRLVCNGVLVIAALPQPHDANVNVVATTRVDVNGG